MAVCAHEADSAVAVVLLVFCGIAFPCANGRQVVNQYAVQTAEVKEVH
jgi:hypothetical protein